MNRLTPKIRSLAWLLLALLLGMTLFRVAFLLQFGHLADLREPEVRRAFYLGLKFDLRLALILLVPAWLLLRPGGEEPQRKGKTMGGPLLLLATFVVYGILVAVAMVDDRAARPWLLGFLALALAYRLAFPHDGLAQAGTRKLWIGYFVLGFGFVVLSYFFDFGAYSYIHTRLNGNLLMFLENPVLSAQMIWQSYPVVLPLVGLSLFLAALARGMAKLLGRIHPAPTGPTWITAVASLLMLFGMYGKLSKYPLRWSEVFEAKQAFTAHLALNPVLFFMETRAEMDGGYDLQAVKASHAAMADYFGIPPRFDAHGKPSLRRTQEPRPQVAGTPNLVFIQLESLSAQKTSLFGNPLDPTPFLKHLGEAGIRFENFHVVMENTSRSMFATLFGIPDVSSVQNATRNPLLVDQYTPVSTLTDYRKLYFLGGSANWAQIRAAMKNNLKDATLYEEGSYRAPVVDVWGISDADLLLEAHQILLKQDGPFWAYVQTSGNHPPFTLPKHHPKFRKQLPDPKALHDAGFVSTEEFNSVRFMDYSLQTYFEQAKEAPYFANSIFVLWADHGVPRGAVDTRYGDLLMQIHHIPFVIYAPGLLKGGRSEKVVGSQMDILPTILSMMGRRVELQTLGKDLFDPAFSRKAAAFTFTTFRRPPRIGLVQDGRYAMVEPDGRVAMALLADPKARDLAPEDPRRAQEMKALAQGFHVWSRFLLRNNKVPTP